MSAKKYRPYLTFLELSRISELLISSEPTSSLSRYISRYLLEIDSGYRSANHTPRPSVEDKLGFGEDTRTTHEQTAQYRYENDLMSPAEEAEYESSFMPTSSSSSSSQKG